jgi:hypothetical protein
MSPSDVKVVLLNGPPRSGKDFAANAIRENWQDRAWVLKFAGPVKSATHAAFGIDRPQDAYEHCKDQPSKDFDGLTPREAYIAFSEKAMKPAFGTDIFGRAMRRQIERAAANGFGLVAISDSGFMEEAQQVRALVGQDNMLLIRLRRNGCSFVGDSRGYIELPGVWTNDVVNPGDATFADDIIERVRWKWKELPPCSRISP